MDVRLIPERADIEGIDRKQDDSDMQGSTLMDREPPSPEEGRDNSSSRQEPCNGVKERDQVTKLGAQPLRRCKGSAGKISLPATLPEGMK